MLVNHHQTVYLSWISTDLPLWNTIETKARLFQKDQETFHLLLNQQNLPCSPFSHSEPEKLQQGIFWLEISPYRITMTMQSNSSLSYRHFWEQGIYGSSRYCLNTNLDQPSQSLNFRNFTRCLQVDGDTIPRNIRIEYELWSANFKLGSYLLHLAIEK